MGGVGRVMKPVEDEGRRLVHHEERKAKVADIEHDVVNLIVSPH